MACPRILRGTGHCAEGRMFIARRWASQIGNWLIWRFFFACRVAQASLGSCKPRVDLSLCQMRSCLRHSADWMDALQPNVPDMPWMPVCWVRLCLPASGLFALVSWPWSFARAYFLPIIFYTLLYFSILTASHFVTPSLFIGTHPMQILVHGVQTLCFDKTEAFAHFRTQ